MVLNADKTEILALHTDSILNYDVTYNSVGLVSELKICGVCYSSRTEREYLLNISQKIEKLTHRIELWKTRNLNLRAGLG